MQSRHPFCLQVNMESVTKRRCYGIASAFFFIQEKRQEDKMRQDETRLNETRLNETRQEKTRQHNTTQHNTPHNKIQHQTRRDKDKTRQDKTRQDKTRQDKTRQDKTRQCTRLIGLHDLAHDFLFMTHASMTSDFAYTTTPTHSSDKTIQDKTTWDKRRRQQLMSRQRQVEARQDKTSYIWIIRFCLTM